MIIKTNDKLLKIGFITLVFIGLYSLPFFFFPQSEWSNIFNLSLTKTLFDFLSTLLLSFCIVELCLFIDRRMNKVLPWTKYTIKRLLFQTIIQIISVFFLLILFSIITLIVLKLLKIEYETSEHVDINVWIFLGSVIFTTLIISSINTINYLTANWRQEIINAAEYKIHAAESKQMAAENELQALRLQLDPHFVFNNLSVLSELILKDQQLGFDYTENFAKVYRYLLLNAKKEVIALSEELKFLDAYLFLLKNRMGAGATFEINVQASKLTMNIPPLTLQLLVENAMKHNSIDKENPLKISIFTNDVDEIVVENNLRPLLKKPHSSGIGLENINRRYALLSDKKPVIIQTENTFIVKIPLLL